MSERTSNKAILEAILGLTEAITKQGAHPAVPVLTDRVEATPVAPKVENTDAANITVPQGYMDKMSEKAQGHATKKGEDVILYARRNGAGETKLAYCLASGFANKRDRGLIGAIKTFAPAA